MTSSTHGSVSTLLAILLAAGLAGCGGPPVTQNEIPSAGGDTPNNPGVPNPGGTNPGNNNPGPTNPPTNTTATANANLAALTTTRATVYNLNTALLGASGWRAAGLLENENGTVSTSPSVGFDRSGNALAVWIQGADVLVSRYSAATGSWSAPVAIDEGIDRARVARVAVDRNTGDAIAAWTQSDGVAESIYASRFNASTNSWSQPELLENSDEVVDPGFASVAIAGSHAAVAWLQNDGTSSSLYLSRLAAGSWTPPELIDTGDNAAQLPQVGIDPNGNALLVWRQFDPMVGYFRIFARRWDNASQTLGAVQALNINGDRLPYLQMDDQGNAIALWSGGGVFVRRFNAASGQWDNEVPLHNASGAAWNAQLSVDGAGNALAVWAQEDGTSISMYARRYLAATGSWGSAQLLENSDASVNTGVFPTVSVNGNSGVVAWVQGDLTADVYASKLNEGTWEAATLLESAAFPGTELTSASDANGNGAVLWVQSDPSARSLYQARFATSNIVVPAGGTWRSIANTLYGVDSDEAGDALQAAMGGGALSEGMILSGFPATLTVISTSTAYYTVLDNDTWAHIAQKVYGVTDAAAIARLQTLLGNPTLSAGLRLEVPTTFQYTTSRNFRAPLDWSRVVTPSAPFYQLNTSLLTSSLDSWSATEQLDSSNVDATTPRVAFDANSNGLAVWAEAHDLLARRYYASTGEWSAPVVLDANPNQVMMPRLAIERASGNAVVSWVQNDGAATSMYVSSFDAANDSWTDAQLLETSNTVVTPSLSVAVAGEHAAITWLQSDGTTNSDVYLSRLVAGTWTAPVVVDTGSANALSPEVAVDGMGNVVVAWRQLNATATQIDINTRRWDNTALAFGAVAAMNTNGYRLPRIGLATNGDGILIWQGNSGEGVFARHYDSESNQWGPQQQLHSSPGAATNGELAVDASGDALVSWTELVGGVNTVYARSYDAATGAWGAAIPVADNITASNISVSLYGSSGVIAWTSEAEDVYAATMREGVWGTATLLETSPMLSSDIASAVDAEGKALVVWSQADASARSIFMARTDTSPYFVVPAGATWQSLADTLYGVDSAAAADALAAAMSNVTLTAGLQLSGLPDQIAVPAVPTHYVVRVGDTWQSITVALYGTNRSEAATALWDLLGRPTLTIGQSLNIPSELAYTIDN